MFKQFDEIELFFKRNQFSEEDLQFLKKSTISKYEDKELLTAALTEIELYVLKYQLTPLEEKLSKNHAKKTKLGRGDIPDIFNIEPSRLVGKTVIQVSSILKVTPEKVIKILLKRKVSVSKVKNLRIREHKTIELLLSTLQRQNEKKQRLKSKKNQKSHLRSVKLKKDFMKTPDVDFLRDEDKLVICEKTGININRLHHIIKNRGVVISDSDKFNKEEFEAIREFIASKLKAKIRNQKMFSYKRAYSPKRSSKITQSYAKGVYGKIEDAGGVGKLIYIRSK